MPIHQNHDIIIIGGGIAGLTASLSFASLNRHVTVFEKNTHPMQGIFGLQLGANATYLLQTLKLFNALEQKASKPPNLCFYCAKTLKKLTHLPIHDFSLSAWKAPYLTIQRQDLYCALLQQAKQSPYINFIANHEITQIDQENNFHFQHTNIPQKMHYNFLIGADGIHSSIRKRFFSNANISCTDKIAWRLAIPFESDLVFLLKKIVDTQSVNVFIHPQFHLVLYPICSGNKMNLVLVTKNITHPSDLSIHQKIHNIHMECSNLFKTNDSWQPFSIQTLHHNKHWIFLNNHILIGDAAHAMPPFMAQGAAIGIEDAFTLAHAIGSSSCTTNNTINLKIWQKKRLQRISRIAHRAKMNHFIWSAQGATALARNIYFSLVPGEKILNNLDWLYGWKPDQE